MDLGLKGRVALVCAASQGLGKAAAAALAREGAHVVICSRDKKRLAAAAEEISATAAAGVEILPVVADLTKAGDIKKFVEKSIGDFQRIDILVSNAGGPPVGSFADLTDKTWEEGVELTLMSTVRMVRAVLPHMQKRLWGRIVVITSLSARQPLNDLIISSTLRPGIVGLAKILANQHGKDGILINAVAPGFFLTARQQEISVPRAAAKGISVEQYLADMTKDVPLGRYGRPEELADVIAFLASERASYVTGTTVTVDGGLIRGLH